MRDIFTIARFTMKDMLSRKSFRISTIIILVLIVVGFNIPSFITSITGGDFNDKVLISDSENLYEGTLNNLPSDQGYDFTIEASSFDSIKEKIENGDIDSAIIIKPGDNEIKLEYVVKNAATVTQLPQQLFDLLGNIYQSLQISKFNLTPAQLAALSTPITYEISQVDEEEISGNLFVMMMMSIVLFYAIYFCAYQVSSSITVEKTSKIIETLVTSTSPRNIVLGKTIGIGLVGLLQMILIVVTAVVSANLFLDHELLASILDLSQVTPLLGLVTFIYFILGYFLFAFIYALTGSTISKPEDIQAANTPVAFLAMIGFYLAYFTLIDPTGSLNSFAAIFPVSSPFCMPIRMMMGLATPLELIFSLTALILTIFIISRIAIKIYSDAILNYGTRLSLSELLKMYKQK